MSSFLHMRHLRTQAEEAPPSPKRSALMGRVRSRDTKPEIQVRRLLHRMGFRYRLHVRGLPGTPDIVFASRRKAILVHGCFWHRHESCRKTTTPKTRQDFWNTKFKANQARDASKIAQLEEAGWLVLVIWECEAEAHDLGDRLAAFLNSDEEHGGSRGVIRSTLATS